MTNEELLKVIEEAKASGATELDLRKKGITALPSEICQLDKLETLRLDGNPLCCPPLEICNQGIGAMRQYLAELDSGTQILNEVKILLVGEGAAGKTSLVKRLFGEGFNEHVDTTLGINIRDLPVNVKGREIKANMWDFGGQEIQRAMHQFFLSKRSLYILVLDVRKDEQPEVWLRNIEVVGGNSPILIVLNKIDENPSFDVNRPFLREKYPSIRGVFSTSCKTNQGIAEFKKALEAELANVKMTAIRWPKSWLDVKQHIKLMGKHCIKAEDYEAICKKAGITEEASRETLLDFLHDLGVAVHFKRFVLNDMCLLRPDWVTNAVYKIITAKETADRDGRLSLKSVRSILKQQEGEKYSYNADERSYVLELMSYFELCHKIGTEEVLIPQQLPADQPDFSFDYDGSLRFVLEYSDFLSHSVFPRFIVKVYKDIKEDKCWRTGVLLEDKKSGTQAVIRADVEVRRISLWVHGERSREYLHYLRYLLADINNSFEKLPVKERVPMPDNPDITVEYENLLNNAKNGINRFIPEGSGKPCEVYELLGLVQPKDKDELVRFVDKIGVKPEKKESLWETAINSAEIEINLLFITINLSTLFKGIRGCIKQRQQEAKK